MKPSSCTGKDSQSRDSKKDLEHDNTDYFRLLAESSLAGIYLIQDGQFRYVNKAFAEMFGYEVEEVLNDLSITDLIYPEDIPLVQQNLQRRVEGDVDSIRYTFRGVRKDRNICHIEVHGSRIVHDGMPGVMGTLIDITEATKAEEALKLSQFIIDNASVGIFLVDDDTRILNVNKCGCTNLGYSKEELCRLTILDIDPSFSWEEWEKHLGSFQQGKSFTMETTYQRKNGETFPVEVLISNLFYNDHLYRISFVQDISEKKQAQIQQQMLEEQFKQVRKLESIGRLAGGVAHDLNNLLTPILGYLGLLYNDNSIQGKAREKLSYMEQAAIGARDLVKQLLAFSRRQVLEHRPLDLNEILEEYEHLLRRTIREDIEIRIVKAGELKLAMLDKGQIEQVLMNLVVNASDAMPNGGQLTLETRMTELDEAYTAIHHDVASGEYVTLSVSDTGIGMDDETVSQVFEPFFSTKGAFGTGLGLATVYGVVKQHKGTIWVYSEPGRGTTFKIYLPVAGHGQVQHGNLSRQKTEPIGECTETILLVEDNEAVRETVYNILDDEGYRVIAAEHGENALEEFDSGIRPDLLLTDVVMPKMNGKELYSRLLETQPSVKCLYMSGYTDDIIVHQGVLDDGVQFIQKPFSSMAILRKVREVLDS